MQGEHGQPADPDDMQGEHGQPAEPDDMQGHLPSPDLQRADSSPTPDVRSLPVSGLRDV